jgi:hypothetical protein
MNTPRVRHRKGLSAADRAARSQLHQLLEQADGLIHGTLIRMARSCGNPNCRCTRKSQKHLSWYLGVTQKRKTRMKHLSKEAEANVRRWVAQYRKARALLEQISQEAWHHLEGG